MNGVPLLLLLIYSGFSINLVLQCALGIKGITESKEPVDVCALVKSLIIFFSIIFLWFFFSRIVYSLIQGIFIYVLVFPASAVLYNGLEYLVFRYIVKKEIQNDSFINFPCGIAAAAVFICINMANTFFEAFVLSFGFTSGIFVVNLIVREIRRRAALEAVPVFFKGKPLVLVAMGLLSLIFTTASLLLFRMIGAQ